MTASTPPVTLRAPELPGEWNFVRNSWTESQERYRPAKVWFDEYGHPSRTERMHSDRFVEGHCKLVDKLLARSTTLVAAVSPGLLAGWLAYEPGCLHYLYVDRSFRRLGVAKHLLASLPDMPRVISHWTPAGERLFIGYQFDPTKAWT